MTAHNIAKMFIDRASTRDAQGHLYINLSQKQTRWLLSAATQDGQPRHGADDYYINPEWEQRHDELSFRVRAWPNGGGRLEVIT